MNILGSFKLTFVPQKRHLLSPYNFIYLPQLSHEVVVELLEPSLRMSRRSPLLRAFHRFGTKPDPGLRPTGCVSGRNIRTVRFTG